MSGIHSKAFVPAEVVDWIKKHPNGHHLFFGTPSEKLISSLGLTGFLERVEKGRFDGVSDDLMPEQIWWLIYNQSTNFGNNYMASLVESNIDLGDKGNPALPAAYAWMSAKGDSSIYEKFFKYHSTSRIRELRKGVEWDYDYKALQIKILVTGYDDCEIEEAKNRVGHKWLEVKRNGYLIAIGTFD